MSMLRKSYLMVLSVLFLVIGCAPKKKAGQTAAETIKVTVAEINRSSEEEQLVYSGNIEADNTVSMGFSVAGRVNGVYVQEGQKVTTGQLLASIEQNTYQNNFAVASAGFEQVQDNFDRLNQLYSKGSLPERDYIAAKVSLVQAKANKETAAKNLFDTKLYASFAGIVTKKLTETGASVAPGIPAFTVVKTDKVYAVASITEKEINTLKIGASAQVYVASIDKRVSGKVSIINPQGDDLSKTYTVKVRIDNPTGQLLPGMIADIQINTGEKNDAIVIPSQAVLRDPDNVNYVFVVKADGIAFKKRVSISRMTGTSNVVVNEGLKVGEKLIIGGHTNLEEGQSVTF